MSNKYYVGDIGTDVIVDVGSDITTASLTNLSVKKPSGKEVTWVGAVVQTTKIAYTTVAGDFDEPGTYKLQSLVTLLSGWSGRGDCTSFIVHNKFDGGCAA